MSAAPPINWERAGARKSKAQNGKLSARVRERDAVLIVLGRWSQSDLAIEGIASTWHGIGDGYGHLRARTLELVVTGRGAAARPRRATLWLPDADGNVSLADHNVVAMRRPG